MQTPLARRDFIKRLTAAATVALLPACSSEDESDRYTDADIERLAKQKKSELELSGTGPFGSQRYEGYRGLARLPWFELDERGNLYCADESIPKAIDGHCHLGISLLLAPDVDLNARAPRVEYLLDCDGRDPVCDLDLDVYVNANFTPDDLAALKRGALAQAVIGSAAARTHTIPNLLEEMDAARVGEAVILPIAFGLPFGDDLTERWMEAIRQSGSSGRLRTAASIHPRDPDRIERLERFAAAGARVLKLHPTMQRFYPDDPDMMEVYAACERLGITVFLHTGRAGIEPEATHRFALPRHYEGAIESFPDVAFVLGHGGSRDAASALKLASRYDNAWLGIHGQGVTQLNEMIEATGGHRMLFGTDWPFYPLAVSLAKVLIVTEGKPELRHAILRGNAQRVFGAASASA